MQEALSDYTRLVIETEWQQLADKNALSAEGWVLRETVYQALLDLTPETPRLETLRGHMIGKIQRVAELRQERENTALHHMNLLFWLAAIVGLVLVTVPYFVFPPLRLHIALLAVYGGFSGLVMFIIFAFADPFKAPGALEPVAFERLVQRGSGRNRLQPVSPARASRSTSARSVGIRCAPCIAAICALAASCVIPAAVT